MAGINVLYDTDDVITIDQGSSWIATFSIFDDLQFRQIVTDKLESMLDLDERIRFPLIHLVNDTDLSRPSIQMLVSNLLLVGGIDDARIESLTTDIMTHTRTIPLAGKAITFYISIFKGSRTYRFNAQATVLDEDNGLITFNIPPEVTQSMVKVKRPHEEVTGRFTIEILNTFNGEIHRILQGDIIVNRGSK
jgi:hypothetical protein